MAYKCLVVSGSELCQQHLPDSIYSKHRRRKHGAAQLPLKPTTKALSLRRTIHIFLEPPMTHAADTLSAQVVQLPPEERMQVVERVLDSLHEPDAALDALWAKEADDRLNAYRRGEVKAVALSEVIAKYQVNTKSA